MQIMIRTGLVSRSIEIDLIRLVDRTGLARDDEWWEYHHGSWRRRRWRL